jgi:glycosyltransferase involved in cell wall biosynthesis
MGSLLEAMPVSEPVPLRRLIIIVPAYNEAGRIAETLTALARARSLLEAKSLAVSIYVVNDGSTDATAELARAAGADRVVNHKVNRGLGAAVRSGLIAARDAGADIAIKFDADLQHDPEDLPAMIAPIVDDEADVVYGNRFERIEYRMPLVRRMGNFAFTRLMAWLTGWRLKDSQPGIFAVGRSYLGSFYLPGDYNYTQQLLLDAYHKGLRFQHVSVAFRPRTSGRSFVSLKYPFKVLPQILRVLVGVKPLRVFGPLALLFLATSAVVSVIDVVDWLRGDTVKPIEHVNLVLGMSLFGVQTLFFGIIADLIVNQNRR